MSRPHDQRELLPPAGVIDEEAGEFWVENPWFAGIDHNLSAFERNRVLLNRGDGTFVEASHLTGGADLDCDSRGVVVADLDGDGWQDLLVRSAGGGGLRIFANRTGTGGAKRDRSMVVRLQGKESNRAGIGARLHLRVAGRSIRRQLYPNNSNSGQEPATVVFQWQTTEFEKGTESLEVQWPSGLVSTLSQNSFPERVVVEEPKSKK